MSEPLQPIAHLRCDFPTKFGLPRQSGLADIPARIVFTAPFRNADALRGIEEYSHLWLIWGFSENEARPFSPTVRPPRLGGNRRIGVFATRSPFRPNGLGLSSVVLERVAWDTPDGPVLHLLGSDLMDGTPIYDIKPYLPYVDCHPDARGGFAEEHKDDALAVSFPEALLDRIPQAQRAALCAALAGDPRPAYQNDPARVYGLSFAKWDIRFTVADGTLTVCAVVPLAP